MTSLPPVTRAPVLPEIAVEVPWTPHRFRAPTGDGALAIEWIGGDLEASRHSAVSLNESSLDVQGRSLSRLRRWAREDCLTAAAEYTAWLRNESVSAPEPESPLFVAGHQPQLFHAGVWAKNFVLGGFTRRGGTGLNLIVDNDTLGRTGILAPVGSAAEPRFEQINYDEPRPPQPWEDAPVVDAEQFDSFGDRTIAAMSAWGIDPVLRTMWPDAIEFRRQGARLVDCLVAARHRQERRWGLENLELPVSKLCEQRSFLWFAGHVLAHLPRFREIHNAVLWDYRQVNHIRSRSHPVPELGEQDGWLEAPFWVWRRGDLRRRHVFARQLAGEIALSDGTNEFARIPLSPDKEACCAVEALERLPSQGIRFRTRALTTTLFARVVLGDLFVHGIGGAKYDEMTDRIIARFFRLVPPPFLMATATLRLPLGGASSAESQSVGRLRHALRDVQFNPDRHGDLPADLSARKNELVSAQHAAATSGLSRRERRTRRTDNRQRYLAFRALRNEWSEVANARRRSLEAELTSAEHAVAARSVLASREYAACLFPEPMLAELFTRARRSVE